MKKTFIIVFAIFLSQISFAQKHWESIVSGTDLWSYLPATSEPPSNWNQPGFDDSSWETGKGGIGYSDGDDYTIIPKSNSLYLRKKFTINNIDSLQYLLLDIDYDDAFVLYLNGKEVARSSNITADPPLFNSPLTTDHEARLYQNLDPERFILNLSDLKTGENLIAVQIINVSITSSDMSSLVYLESMVNSSTTVYKATPSWFKAPFESHLPLVFIDTWGQAIPNEPKIMAKMKVIDNASGLNSSIDTSYEYNSYCGIELHGSSSQMYPKKSYGLETRFANGENNNVPLMGLPKENDWVLYAPYSDKTMIRNVLAYRMGNLTGRWSPHTRYCELFLNNEYRGVYVLVEKIKIDKHRLDLARLKPTDISGDQLTGGYVLKIDRPDSGYWVSPYKARNNLQDVPISYLDPKCADLTTEQKNYIKYYITAFETSLWSSNYKDPVLGYRHYIDLTSFVDYYIVNEISKNLDANRVSTYFYKDKDSRDGRIIMGPFWDYNIAFGNANFYSCGKTDGWVVDGVGNGDQYGITFWWDKFRADPYFNYNLVMRWSTLRRNQFSNQNLMHIIDSCASVLSEAQKRNYQKFDILSSYVWPNNYIGGTYANEVSYLKTWITNRLIWMDNQMMTISGVNDIQSNMNGSVKVLPFPNPFAETLHFNFNLNSQAEVNIRMSDLLGRVAFNKTYDCSPGEQQLDIKSNELQSISDIYTYSVFINNQLVSSGKIAHR